MFIAPLIPSEYLYLLFSDMDDIPLDRYVFNTEAHILPVFTPTVKRASAFLRSSSQLCVSPFVVEEENAHSRVSPSLFTPDHSIGDIDRKS